MKLGDLKGTLPQLSLGQKMIDGGDTERNISDYNQFPIGSVIGGGNNQMQPDGTVLAAGANIQVTKEKVQGSNATWNRIWVDVNGTKFATSEAQLCHSTIPFGVSVAAWKQALEEHPELKQVSKLNNLKKDLAQPAFTLKDRFEIDRTDGSHASIEVWV